MSSELRTYCFSTLDAIGKDFPDLSNGMFRQQISAIFDTVDKILTTEDTVKLVCPEHGMLKAAHILALHNSAISLLAHRQREASERRVAKTLDTIKESMITKGDLGKFAVAVQPSGNTEVMFDGKTMKPSYWHDFWENFLVVNWKKHTVSGLGAILIFVLILNWWSNRNNFKEIEMSMRGRDVAISNLVSSVESVL